MRGHHRYLKVFALTSVMICSWAFALTQVELQRQIEGQPPAAAIRHLNSMQDEVRHWPPAEQIDYYRLLSELHQAAPAGHLSTMKWLLVFLLGAASVALIVYTRKPRMQQFSIAQTDSLTTLYNHNTIFDIGKALFRSAAAGSGRNLSAIVIELDALDQIKQQHGDKVADQMLQLAALNSRYVLRGNDCIGRMGHEQFLVVLPNTGIRQALEVAERIHSRLDQYPLTLDECPVRATISIGIAGNHAGADSFESMAKRAGSARKEARERGKNQTVVAD